MTKEFETMYMRKVTYSNKNSKIIHTALFTDVMEAEHFKEMLQESGECSFVGLNNWTWETKIEK